MSTAFTIPAEVLTPLLAPLLEQAVADYLRHLPAPDPWLTIPEAAAYAKLTERYMAQLVYGKPYRAATNGKPERAAIAPKIPAGDTGFARGARVRQSAVDAYLTRHAYLNR
ncbi:hypothetical protein [Hymenobacter negativus]|uniref:DNA-binding protein n=1 Tax=Hymenobacter negativus TaxID=2795026 RepID=A0ABS3QDA3_9BACT|nr:hypothetical protein [Hymenobacter negativus]MBO2009208.1 hypothetical protein [Hymenobacter negativus]